MKCNYKAKLKGQVAHDIAQTSSTIKRLWEVATLVALHREFGFGAKRLKRFVDSITDVYSEFERISASSDKYDRKKREFSNIDTAILMMLRELRRDGIDHRDILGDENELVIIDEDGKQTNLDELLDKIERW